MLILFLSMPFYGGKKLIFCISKFNKKIVAGLLATLLLSLGAAGAFAQNRGTRVKVKKGVSGKTAASRKQNKKTKPSKLRDEDKKPKIIRLDRNADPNTRGPVTGKASEFGITPPIIDNPAVRDGLPPFKGVIEIEDEENNEVEIDRTIPGAGDYPFEDPLAELAREQAALAPTVMPAPALTFNGILSNDLITTFGTTSMPPDTVGDVGPNHYVQATNLGVYRVFNKNGTPATATARISTLFAGLPSGSPCRVQDDGDPGVNYDPLADRWLVSQFVSGGATLGLCIAVSATGNPTGAWYAYFFPHPEQFLPDYPHWGVWTDGYYLATHDLTRQGDFFLGGAFWAFDRSKMLVGDPTAGFIRFSRSFAFGQLPADIDGYMPPPAGIPATFFEIEADEFGGTDGVQTYELVPDFTTPANSTFTVKSTIASAPFDPRNPSGRSDIEQPPPADSTDNIDSIGGFLMFRVGYRNLGTVAAPVNSYVMNATVNVSGVNPTNAGNYQAAPRWFEMRRSGAGVMSIFDQGTHAPDPVSGTGRNRWVGSIAQDYLGNLAIGFSRSGPGAGQFPDIVWAGRTGGQTPAGTMNQGETVMFASTGVQQNTGVEMRWGDYSSMTVDPADDCTFWFTSMWRDSAFNGTANSNPFRWSTRIGNFKFPVCNSQPKGQISSTVKGCASGLPINNARVTAGSFIRLTNASGNLTSNITAAPGNYSVTASKGVLAPGTAAASVINGQTTNVNLCLGGSVVGGTTATISNESCSLNNAADRGETLTVTLTLQNTDGNATTNLIAAPQLTGGIIAASPAQTYGALDIGASATRSFNITIDPYAAPASSITLTLALSDGAFDLGTATYAIPFTGNAAQNFNYTGSAIPIPDFNTTGVNADVNVSGVNGSIVDLNFQITGQGASPSNLTGLEHPRIGDLEIRLTSPQGTTVLLVDRIRGPVFDCLSNDIFNLTLDDSAANPVDSSCPGSDDDGPLTGTFKPQNPLSAFSGENANGTWTLNVRDRSSGSTGTLRNFRLQIISPTTTCAIKLWTGATSSDWHTASNWTPAGVPVPASVVIIPATGVTNEPTISTFNVIVSDLTVVSPRVLNVNAERQLNVTGRALVNGNLNVKGSIALGANVGLTGSNVVFDGTTAQTIPALAYNNLTIDNASGTTLGGDATVAGTLTLTNGTVDAGANTLTVSSCAAGAISGGGASSFVRGSLTRCINNSGTFAFPVGTASGYTPVSLSNIVGNANFTVKSNNGFMAGISNTQSAQRFWNLIPTGSLVSANLTLTYLQSDVGSSNEANYQFIRRSGTVNTGFAPTTANTATNTFTLNGVTGFSDWALGVNAPTAASVTVGGKVTFGRNRGLARAAVSITDATGSTQTTYTNSFGYYRFESVSVGQTYVVTVQSKRDLFAPRVIFITDAIEDLNFTPLP